MKPHRPAARLIGAGAGVCLILSAAGWSADRSAASRKLLEDLKSSDHVRQAEAKQLLRTYSFKDIVRPMASFARDPNPDMRILMIQTLGELGGFEAAGHLKKLFSREKDSRVRRAILVQLAGLMPDEKDAFRFFRKAAFSDPSEELRFLSLNQLSLLGGNTRFKKDLIKIFRKVLKEEPAGHNKIFAAVALKELGDDLPELEGLLLTALKNRSVEIRRRASLLLGSVRDPGAFDQMSVAARDPDAEVRANLCRSLGESRSGRSVPILKSLASDKDPVVRKNAFNVLAGIPVSEVGTALFLDALSDGDPLIRSSAVAALEKSGDSAMAPHLQKIAEKDPDTSVRALARKAVSTLSKTP